MKYRLVFILWVNVMIFAPQGLMASMGGPFQIIVGSYNNASEYIILKYNKVTGETWIKGKDGFESLPENQKIQESIYYIEITDFMEGWLATRIDSRTGRTWTLKEGKWFEIM